MSEAVAFTRIPEAAGLDTIIVYWHDIGPGKGYVTITCWGSAWTAYFGGMGAHDIKSFFASADVPYLINKLGTTQWLKSSKKHDLYLGRIVFAIQESLRK
jgi:hypothetical protein